MRRRRGWCAGGWLKEAGETGDGQGEEGVGVGGWAGGGRKEGEKGESRERRKARCEESVMDCMMLDDMARNRLNRAVYRAR